MGKKQRAQNKTLRKFLQKCEQAGCEWWVRGNSHIAVRLPDGQLVYMSSTPKDPDGAIAATVRVMRRYGFEFEVA